MSKIDELIAKLCPEGVEYKELGEICQNISTGKLNANAMVENGRYPFFTCDSKPYKIDEYRFDIEAILVSGNGSQVGHVNYYKGKFNAYQRTYVLSEFLLDVNIWYIYFYFKQYLREYIFIHSKKGSIPYITLPMLKNFQIPIPPLPVQEEIVRILDKFTALEAELEAELEARTRQYEYYRNQLLSFEGKDVEWKALGDIGEFIRGKRFVRTDMIESGFPCIHYGEMYTYYNVFAKESKSFISEELAKKLRVANKGDVVIVAAGETIEDIGKATAWLGDSDVVIHDACFTFKSSLNPKFVAYFSRTKLFHDQIKRHISSGKISAINAKGLEKAKIPVPPLDEQERIVAILDKFDTLVNDISTGLPAEIQARRQQYEYYREKLLTFEPVALAQ